MTDIQSIWNLYQEICQLPDHERCIILMSNDNSGIIFFPATDADRDMLIIEEDDKGYKRYVEWQSATEAVTVMNEYLVKERHE